MGEPPEVGEPSESMESGEVSEVGEPLESGEPAESAESAGSWDAVQAGSVHTSRAAASVRDMRAAMVLPPLIVILVPVVLRAILSTFLSPL
ncbi:MAG: hypothetical protein H0T76_15335 [Nannocystis sp.]|nr:hypothetical protein [Nannocystis sp.]MBA3547855.1 hypothetical protein [Nannocystis sp.]